jgi:hypothetical protein
MRTLILTVVLLSLLPFSLYASARSDSGGLPERVAELEEQMERVAELEAQVEELTDALQDAQEILQYVRVETEVINRLAGPHLIFEGVNVHVQSGSGNTRDSCWGGPQQPDYPNCESLTGLGNLIVGYNEPFFLRDPPIPPGPFNIRTGSHNLVVGQSHSYSSFAGFVAGNYNAITAANASVCGGVANWASGYGSSISGGQGNDTIGFVSAVAGGLSNRAEGGYSSVSGGNENLASGNVASVSGGYRNEASGALASVSGGRDREAPGEVNWVAGSLFEPN